MADPTIVEYFAEHERYRCGYCGQSDTNYSHGMWAHQMSVQDYQDLLDRGWRRSGKYCYKPTMSQTCCPQYTIRMEPLNFKLRKSHKKVLKKVNRYLIDGIKPSCNQDEDLDEENQSMSAEAGKSDVQSGEKKNAAESTASRSDCDKTSEKQVKTPRQGEGADPNKPQCKKAKELRREKKLAKLAEKSGTDAKQQPKLAEQASTSSKPAQSEGKSLEDWLDEPNKAEKCAHKLEIRLVRSFPQGEDFKSSLTESHGVYHKYQMDIHKDPADKPNLRQFTRFLVDSPLMDKHPGGTLPMGYGSFHQQYILDGKIICAGVIDILPSLVSSKYLYYDPDYHFLSLGTYSALREIAFIRDLHKHSKQMRYYYMGFYIHSCPKMKYKGQYFPSFLLCPETYEWIPVEKCSPMLDETKYCRFATEDKKDRNGDVKLDEVAILWQRQMMNYQIYSALGKHEDAEEVREYAGLVGKKCAKSILLFRK